MCSNISLIQKNQQNITVFGVGGVYVGYSKSLLTSDKYQYEKKNAPKDGDFNGKWSTIYTPLSIKIHTFFDDFYPTNQLKDSKEHKKERIYSIKTTNIKRCK